MDESGNTVVKYSYNAWGVVTKTNAVNTTAAGIIYTYNPYLYKGYYYDSKIELYYCNTRYYSPKLCRWISADAIQNLNPSTLENVNLYTYCHNNPVMMYDPNGEIARWVCVTLSVCLIVTGVILCATGTLSVIGGMLIGAGAGSIINGYVSEANRGDFSAGYIGGLVSGANCAAGAGLG
ncbi:MAG: RHS repeat-associated core domain-containing protein [Bacillales bacterium]|nr:RHS repeat-associated core domain-containing protein [Bacillales bacterium]